MPVLGTPPLLPGLVVTRMTVGTSVGPTASLVAHPFALDGFQGLPMGFSVVSFRRFWRRPATETPHANLGNNPSQTGVASRKWALRFAICYSSHNKPKEQWSSAER
jgi:hypothetical protein